MHYFNMKIIFKNIQAQIIYSYKIRIFLSLISHICVSFFSSCLMFVDVGNFIAVALDMTAMGRFFHLFLLSKKKIVGRGEG